MTTRSTWYTHQCIAASGIAIMDAQIAFELRPDLWASPQDCRMTFRKVQSVAGVKRMSATFAGGGIGTVLVLARSLDNLAKRLEWIVGLPVVDLTSAEPEMEPVTRQDPMRREADAKEAERLAQVHKLAKEVPPGHDCQHRRDILAARAELGMPVA